jgi:hypothetical protein
MKRYKFELGRMYYIFYSGRNMGAAIKEFIKDRPNYLDMIESITEEPIQAYERP